MKPKIIDVDSFTEKIANLLIDSDYESDNAYNWGLIDAQFLINGVDPQDVINMRMNRTLGAIAE